MERQFKKMLARDAVNFAVGVMYALVVKWAGGPNWAAAMTGMLTYAIWNATDYGIRKGQ